MILKQISLPCEHTRMHWKNPFQARDQSGSSGLRRAQRRDKSRAEGCGCLRRGAQPARKCDTAQSIFVNLSLTLGGRWHPPPHTHNLLPKTPCKKKYTSSEWKVEAQQPMTTASVPVPQLMKAFIRSGNLSCDTCHNITRWCAAASRQLWRLYLYPQLNEFLEKLQQTWQINPGTLLT